MSLDAAAVDLSGRLSNRSPLSDLLLSSGDNMPYDWAKDWL